MDKNNLNIINDFIKVFSENVESESVNYDGRTLYFKLKKDIKESQTIIKSLFDKYEILLNDKIEIILSSIKFKNVFLYYEITDYFNNYEKYSEVFDDSVIVIIQSENGSIIKNTDEVFSKQKSIIFNFLIYQKLLLFLKENLLFTTLLNETNNQFIIVSRDNGVFKIGFRNSEEKVKDLDDLKPIFEELKILFEKKEFVQFFKEIIANSGIHDKDIRDRFFEVVKNLKIFLSLAEKDYESYVLDFAFDKIKSKFKEERNKYFDSLEKNIDTVTKQVFAFPLTFSATAFASYQVKDKPWILSLILLAYLLYTFIAFYILSMVRYNIICLKSDVSKEEDEIKKTYNKIYSDFKEDFQKIWKKIKKLECLIKILKIILVILLISFVLFLTIQALNPQKDNNTQSISIPTQNIHLYINHNKSVKTIDSTSKSLPVEKLEIKKDSVIKKVETKHLTNKKKDSPSN